MASMSETSLIGIEVTSTTFSRARVIATFNLVYLVMTVLTAYATFLLARRSFGDELDLITTDARLQEALRSV